MRYKGRQQNSRRFPKCIRKTRKARWSRVLYTSLPWCLSANRISSRLYLLITAAGLCSCTGNRPWIAHCYARGVKQLSLVNECIGLEHDCAQWRFGHVFPAEHGSLCRIHESFTHRFRSHTHFYSIEPFCLLDRISRYYLSQWSGCLVYRFRGN